MFAGATTIVLSVTDFPNGGGGFKGRSVTGALTTSTPPVRRPSWAIGDVAYYRYTVVVCAILFLLALLHVAGKPGRAWASIRESEPAALAAGVNITLYKLWAFALASFMTGVAGCLLAAQVGVPRAITFQTQDSLTLAATALIGGIFSLWGAVVAGVFNQLLPFLFQAQWGLNPNFLLILFGVGLLQVLLTAPGGLAQQLPKDLANLGAAAPHAVRARSRAGTRRRRDRGRGPHRALRRRHPDRRRERRLPRRDLRPDRPERRRQDDVLQRPQRLRQARRRLDPRPSARTCSDGRLQARALGAAAHVPDRAGDRAAVGVRQRGDDPRALGREARAPGGPTCWPRSSSSGSRSPRRPRSAGSARASGGSSRSPAPSSAVPASCCSTSPRAGLPDEETEHLGQVIQTIPEQFGALVILVDHDMSLVSACCETTAVLDFGKLIASGPTAEVLRDEHVMRAYLGTEEEL